MKRTLPVLALLGGCALREPRVSSPSCASNVQCSRGDVCFLGECRSPAANLSLVDVEVQPPSGSPFGLRTFQIDVRRTALNDFSVAIPLNIGDPSTPGTITQAQSGGPATAVASAIVTFSAHAPLIPDRVEQIVSSPSDTSGAYHARVPQGTWDVLVQAPAPLPPIRFGVLDTRSPAPSYVLPALASLPQLDGGVTYDGGVPLAGASITAVDGSGAALSTAAVSQVDGSYALYLAPDAGTAALQIGPYVATDGGTAQTSPLDPFPTYQPVAWAPAVDLPLTAVVNLSGHVIDSTAAPVPGARVYARSVNASWTLSRSVVADTVGAYALTLRAGNYMVQAAPGTDATLPALSDVQSVSIVSAATLADVICPAKVRRNGRIYGPDGRQVTGNYQIVATRLSTALVTTRTITTASDPTGFYRIAADAGRWRFEVIPPADAALPRAIAQFDLDPSDPGESSLPGIQIPPPLKLGGTVKGSATGTTDVVVPGAQVSFFALDSEGHSVFLGGGLTDSMGRYDVIVPDVGQASLGP